MSTRSNIGYKNPKTGKFHYIYCHWDGYLSWNGRILRDHYKTLAKVKMLVNLGSLSSLNKNVRPPKNPIQKLLNGTLVPIEKHTYEEPDRNTVVAYHRDRGEPLTAPTVSDNFPVEEEWAYCFMDGKWFYKTYRYNLWTEIPEGDLKVAQEEFYKLLGF